MSSPWRTPPQNRPKKLDESVLRKLRESLETLNGGPDYTRPRLVGDVRAPVEFSTSLGLDIHPRFIWDTNGFYRAFGLKHDATRTEVLRAVGRLWGLEGGSEWHTNAALVLLSKKLRRKYDATPLGAFWANDPHLVDPRQLQDRDSEMVAVEGWPWAYYVLGPHDDDVDERCMGMWRTGISISLHGVIAPSYFALGVRPGEAISIELIGQRIVILVGIALKPSWDYAHAIAAELRRIVDDSQATASPEKPLSTQEQP